MLTLHSPSTARLVSPKCCCHLSQQKTAPLSLSLEWTQDPPGVDYLASPGEFDGGGPGLEL